MVPTCESLVEGHLDALLAFARWRLRRADVAEEVVQRTFLKAFEKRTQLREVAAARSWLLSILRNEIAMEHRGNARFEVWDAEDFEELQQPEPEEALDPALIEALPAALERLSEGARSILLLRFQQELTYEEIARLLDLPVGTVQSRLHRAKVSLKALLVSESAAWEGGVA